MAPSSPSKVRPGPAADLVQARVVDRDDHHLPRRRLGTALLQPVVERTQIEQVEWPPSGDAQGGHRQANCQRDAERNQALPGHGLEAREPNACRSAGT